MIAVSQDCNYYEFQCDNGQCVSFYGRCDCYADCADGSDEADCEDSGTTTTCDSGECITEPKWCNCYVDCADGSDERDCPNSECHHCADTGSVYHSHDRCDCDKQCSDGSDEWDCDDDPLNKRFECSSEQCVDTSQRCDGTTHCANGADEENCDSKRVKRNYMYIPVHFQLTALTNKCNFFLLCDMAIGLRSNA